MEQRMRKPLQFIGATYLFSYLLAGLFTLSGGSLKSPAGFALAVVYMFVPLMVVLVLQKGIERKPLRELGISFRLNRWFFFAWFLPPLLAIATMGMSLLFPGVSFTPGMEGLYQRFGASLTPAQIAQMKAFAASSPVHPFWIGLLQALAAGITVNAIAAFGEEIGWRGYLQKNLGFLGFWKGSFLIGLVWGFWHAPLILLGHNYPQHPVLGVFMMTAWTILLAPIFSYVRIKSRSVIAAAILHGTLNGSAGLALMLIRGGNDLTVGMTGSAGFIVLSFVNLLILVFDRSPSSEKLA